MSQTYSKPNRPTPQFVEYQKLKKEKAVLVRDEKRLLLAMKDAGKSESMENFCKTNLERVRKELAEIEAQMNRRYASWVY